MNQNVSPYDYLLDREKQLKAEAEKTKAEKGFSPYSSWPLSEFQAACRQEAVREWLQETLGDDLLEGVSVGVHNLDSDSGGDSPKNFAQRAIRIILKDAGFQQDDIDTCVESLE
jgi:hypothetical protein